MREIEFRGRQGGGEWFYGGITRYANGNVAIFSEIAGQTDVSSKNFVVAETVGQYVGFTDRNGKRIYEGDLLSLGSGSLWLVVWSYDYSRWEMHRSAVEWALTPHGGIREIVGNRHDNPDLARGLV